MKLSRRTLVVFLLAGFLQACSSGGDSEANINEQTYGRQLIDLKAAHDQGIITEKEYERSRKAIVERMED